MQCGSGTICRTGDGVLMQLRQHWETGKVNVRLTQTDHSGQTFPVPPVAGLVCPSGHHGRKNMVYGVMVRGSRSKTMTITRLADSNHRLNIMIMNANMGITEKQHGITIKDTIINGTRGKHPWIPRMSWLLRITGSMNAPELTIPDPDHKTH